MHLRIPAFRTVSLNKIQIHLPSKHNTVYNNKNVVEKGEWDIDNYVYVNTINKDSNAIALQSLKDKNKSNSQFLDIHSPSIEQIMNRETKEMVPIIIKHESLKSLRTASTNSLKQLSKDRGVPVGQLRRQVSTEGQKLFNAALFTTVPFTNYPSQNKINVGDVVFSSYEEEWDNAATVQSIKDGVATLDFTPHGGHHSSYLQPLHLLERTSPCFSAYRLIPEGIIQAATHGHADAQYNLADMYYNGQGVEQSYEKAIEYYTMAAKQGNADAQFNLGFMYRNGEGVKRSYKKAIEYYTMAERHSRKMPLDGYDDFDYSDDDYSDYHNIFAENSHQKKRKCLYKK